MIWQEWVLVAAWTFFVLTVGFEFGKSHAAKVIRESLEASGAAERIIKEAKK